MIANFIIDRILALNLLKTVLVSSFRRKEHAKLLTLVAMTKSSEEILGLRAKAEASLNKTAQLQQALAQLEANL